MAQYGEVRVDFITYTTGTPGVGGGEQNVTVPVSGLINNPLFSGDVIFGGDVTISGDLIVSGDSSFNDITTSGDVTISGILTVTGDTNVGGDLAVTGNISGNADGGVYGSGYWKVPDGTTAQRPTPAESGMIRYNTDQERYEGYGEDGWDILGGGATGSGTDRVFILNETGVTASYTLTGYNAVSAGAITIEDGIEVTIADTFGWSIV
jgi:hypothetical protein